MIRAGCRTQFTSSDFQFLVETLARKSKDNLSLESLLADPTSLDELLDSDALLDAILTRRDCLPISPHLYFYVIARRVLRNAGIQDRAVADYLGAMLTDFSETSRTQTLATRPGQQFAYISDLLAVISEASAEETFVVRAHIGNYTLFLTGVFPQHIEQRARYKGAPDIEFYEGVGSANFRLLSDHSLARKRHLDEVFGCLAEQFREIRRSLNDAADRLLHLDATDAPVGRALKLLSSGTP
jgi:hypothetical protein